MNTLKNILPQKETKNFMKIIKKKSLKKQLNITIHINVLKKKHKNIIKEHTQKEKKNKKIRQNTETSIQTLK